MTKDTSENCELCGSRILDERCEDCNHQKWTSNCTCDACVEVEEDDDDEQEESDDE